MLKVTFFPQNHQIFLQPPVSAPVVLLQYVTVNYYHTTALTATLPLTLCFDRSTSVFQPFELFAMGDQ